MILRSINPNNGNELEKFEEFSHVQLEEKLNVSVFASAGWSLTDFQLRSMLMKKVAATLRKNITGYSSAITLEMGKPVTESRAEIAKCAWVCDYYAENAADFLSEDKIKTDAFMSYVSYEAIGPVLGIMPWNFPFWQVFRFAVPTLMAGNTVLLKHASNVQICARNIEEIFTEAGFPPGVFTNLVISSAMVEKVIGHHSVKAVSITGSESAGQKVAESAGRNIKKSLLELGGSNAFVVLNDADIGKAVETGLKARMMNAGQSCIAAKRFIIDKQVAEKFIELYVRKAKELKVGDPSDEGTEMGPLASVAQAEIVEKQVNMSVQMGARILSGGIRNKAFYSPSVIIDVSPGMPVFDEEVFGPVAPILIAENTGEAMRLAAMTEFGLGISLFTNDLEKATELAKSVKDGAVFVNELVRSDPRLPFGGTGRSGYGRELSIQGIREFVNVKTVYIKKF